MSRQLRRSFLLATGVAVMAGLSGPAAAQVIWVRPALAPLPPQEIAGILRHELAFRSVGRPDYVGSYYVVPGVDRAGMRVRVLVHGLSGKVVDVELLGRAPQTRPRVANLPERPAAAHRAVPVPPKRTEALRPLTGQPANPAPTRQDAPDAARLPEPAPLPPVASGPPSPPVAAPGLPATSSGVTLPPPAALDDAQPVKQAAPMPPVAPLM